MPNNKGMQVKWTVDEHKIVADHVWQGILEDPGIPMSRLFEEAQKKCLPPDRRRLINSRLAAAPVMKLVEKRAKQIANDVGELRRLRIEAEHHQETVEGLKSEIAQIRSRDVELDDLAECLSDNEILARVADLPPEDILAEYPLPKLAGYVTEQIVANWLGQPPVEEDKNDDEEDPVGLSNGDRHEEPEAEEAEPEPEVLDLVSPKERPRKAKLPRVLVVGMQSKDMASLRDKVPFVELLHNDGREYDLGLPKNVDGVFVVTKFINHPMRNKVEKFYGRHAVTKVNGGLSSIEKAIKDAAFQRPSMAS